MKVLLMGDGSAYHANLAIALRGMGHDVTVASDGTRWMQTERDIDLSRSKGKLGGALLWMRLSGIDARRLKGYDVVQLSSPGFAPLRPKRLRVLFDRLKRDNGIVCLTALGTDSVYVRHCLFAKPPVLRYSEWKVGSERTPWSYTPILVFSAGLLSGKISKVTLHLKRWGRIQGCMMHYVNFYCVLTTS